jgi:hypothetical protein
MALDTEFAKYDNDKRIPIDTVVQTVNKVTAGKPRVVVLPKEDRAEAMKIVWRKMSGGKLKFGPGTSEVVEHIPKNSWEDWWENDPEDHQALSWAMRARSMIASVWAGEKYGPDVFPIARPVPMTKNQAHHLVEAIHVLHERK